MNIERFTRNRLICYQIHSEYDGDSIAMDPKELLALSRWLTEHENEIVNDSLANMTQEAEQEKQQPQRCDHCHKEVDALYDLTPAAIEDITTIHVCSDCYELVAHELEQDGYNLDL